MRDLSPRRQQTLEVIVTAGGVRLEDVFGTTRDRRVLLVRRAICVALRDVHQMSLPEIAAVFGRDHSSVRYRIRDGRRILKEEASLLAMSSAPQPPEATPLTSLLRTAYTRLNLHEWPEPYEPARSGRSGTRPAEAGR